MSRRALGRFDPVPFHELEQALAGDAHLGGGPLLVEVETSQGLADEPPLELGPGRREVERILGDGSSGGRKRGERQASPMTGSSPRKTRQRWISF